MQATVPPYSISPPRLHPGQGRVYAERRRFTVLACGRRWGKTRLGVALCLRAALKGGRVWWVAPSYKMAGVGWRLIRQMALRGPLRRKSETERLVEFHGGGLIQVRSADDPDSLRGEGLDGVVLDECAYMREEAWTEALRPALSDRQGWALFISTPKGRNWFWRLYLHEHEDYKSFCFPTTSNPFIDDAEVKAARATLPDRIFRQEYLAEFIEDSGAVFRRVTEAATAGLIDQAEPGQDYVMGVDWGKHEDFTVLTMIDRARGAVVALDRFNQIDYAVQLGRLAALVERFHPVLVVVERNSMGEPLLEQLVRQGLPVEGFTTTNQTKAEIIESLVLAFERGEIQVPPDEVLINELQAYEMERLPSGRTRYQAPAGLHDDCVMSLALAWYAKLSGGGWLLA